MNESFFLRRNELTTTKSQTQKLKETTKKNPKKNHAKNILVAISSRTQNKRFQVYERNRKELIMTERKE